MIQSSMTKWPNYNAGHNILELYSVLVKLRFSTSKMKLDR